MLINYRLSVIDKRLAINFIIIIIIIIIITSNSDIQPSTVLPGQPPIADSYIVNSMHVLDA